MKRIGVVGTGHIGKTHIKRIESVIEGATVVAVSDINEESARSIAKEINAEFFADGNELIHSDKVDAVVIASWDPTHAGYVKECIKAGKRALCEKPLASTAEETREIVEAEMKGGKRLIQVGFNRHFDPGFVRLKEVIDSGELGDVLMVHCSHRNKFHIPSHTSDMTIKNAGIHEIDVLRWLLSDEYESGQAFAARQNNDAAEGLLDPQMMLLRTRKGILIDAEVNMSCNYGYDIQCEVVCQRGVVKLEDANAIRVKQAGSNSSGIYPDWSYRFIESYNHEFQQWVNSLYTETTIGPTAWDGYVACITADSLIKARNAGTVEKMNGEDVPEFYK